MKTYTPIHLPNDNEKLQSIIEAIRLGKVIIRCQRPDSMQPLGDMMIGIATDVGKAIQGDQPIEVYVLSEGFFKPVIYKVGEECGYPVYLPDCELEWDDDCVIVTTRFREKKTKQWREEKYIVTYAQIEQYALDMLRKAGCQIAAVTA